MHGLQVETACSFLQNSLHVRRRRAGRDRGQPLNQTIPESKSETTIHCYFLHPKKSHSAEIRMLGGVADDNGKDGGSNPAPTRPPPGRAALPTQLLRPLLLVALLATCFLAVVVLLGGSAYSVLPRLSVPADSALHAPPSSSLPQRVRLRQAPLERWTRAPSTAWHDMTDEELLWAASWRPTKTGRYPYRRVPKVAFLFLTRGPLPLAPLWERFFAGAGRELYSVYVHAMPGYHRPDDFPPSSPFHRRQVPSQVVEWGEVSMVDAERRLLANALLDPANERFVLVSESCIPLFGFPVVYDYLTRSRQSFVSSYDDTGPGGRGRYPGGLAPEVSLEQWRKGSQWFEMDRALAVVVVADERYYPKFREHCIPTCYTDEHYVQTVLSIEAQGRVANRSVTWTDWSWGGAHPATFWEAHVDEAFLKRLTTKAGQGNCTYNGRTSELCFLFARKFAPNALQPLLTLAPKMLGYG
ncbi:hypothetical protein SETIT_3G404300v2 [Setaria italica]|uniref:Uncharacterized protein n=2 Tax=Setaria italica TaxID=4555 RepID=A0A368QPJ6_SETIT|nr:hypothetical protein SETIT_3G404300v2 [Setaria italica]